MDRRSKRTRAWLLDTLLELIGENDYADISVTELTERADIARQTFYRNYSSMDDILLSRMDEIRDEYMVKVRRHLDTKKDPYWDFEVRQMLELWQKNEALFRALQKAGLAFQALERFTEIFTMLHMKIQGLEELDEKHRYLVYYLSGGVYMVLNKWLEGGMTFPLESMTDLFKRAAENINQIGREYRETS
jgi:AcrR family transcriptional regulator